MRKIDQQKLVSGDEEEIKFAIQYFYPIVQNRARRFARYIGALHQIEEFQSEASLRLVQILNRMNEPHPNLDGYIRKSIWYHLMIHAQKIKVVHVPYHQAGIFIPQAIEFESLKYSDTPNVCWCTSMQEEIQKVLEDSLLELKSFKHRKVDLKDIFVRHFLQDQSPTEIGKVYGVSQQAISQSIELLKAKLRKGLQDDIEIARKGTRQTARLIRRNFDHYEKA